jgi:hypothetical protein
MCSLTLGVEISQAKRPDMQGDRPPRPRGLNAKKVGLAIANTLLSVNMWTGAPLLALWVGARVASSPGRLTMGAFWVVLAVLAIVEALLVVLLTRVHAAYDELTGRPIEARRASPWLRSLRGEREEFRRTRVRSSALEIIVMASVVCAVLAFEVWFFFFAHYAYPGGNGGRT